MIKTNLTNTKNFFEKSHKKLVLDVNRRTLLVDISDTIKDIYLRNNKLANINFICTHNSRRSQLGQMWAFFASHYFVLNIFSFSGGTEVTALHRNIARTLKEVGFSFSVKKFSHQNPFYRVSFEGTKDFILGFSKTFDHPINKSPYIAIITCNSADQNCPYIAEATHRFHLPYTDPKEFDGSQNQEAAYLKTNERIAAEVYFIFDRVKKSL